MAAVKRYPIFNMNHDPAYPYGGWIWLVSGTTGAGSGGGGTLKLVAQIGSKAPADFNKQCFVVACPMGDQFLNADFTTITVDQSSSAYNATTGELLLNLIALDNFGYPVDDYKISALVYIPDWKRGGLTNSHVNTTGADYIQLEFNPQGM